MTTVAEVGVRGKIKGVNYAHVFHIVDDNDTAVPSAIALFFLTDFVGPLAAFQNELVVYSAIQVKSLTAANPYDFTLTISDTGVLTGDMLPTGVHINVFLNTDDFQERGGGKMPGGFEEGSYTDGLPGSLLLAGVEQVFDDLITGINPAVGVVLGVLRSVASTPGFPVAALVSGATAKGTSTNNRRNEPFVA